MNAIFKVENIGLVCFIDYVIELEIAVLLITMMSVFCKFIMPILGLQCLGYFEVVEMRRSCNSFRSDVTPNTTCDSVA